MPTELDSNTGSVAAYQEFVLNNRVICTITALVAYEHLITLKYEVNFLCGRKWSAATWIFVMNRYLLLAYVSFSCAPFSPQMCDNSLAADLFHFFATGTLYTLPIRAFTILRTFALLQNNIWRRSVTWLLVALTVVVTTSSTFADFSESWEYIADPVLGSSCYTIGYAVAPGIIQRISATTSAIDIMLGTIVLGVTLSMTTRQVLQASSLGWTNSLSQILLRDGSMFFVLNILGDIFAAANRSVSTTAHNIMPGLPLSILPNILLSRFIINLRQADSSTISSIANQHSSRFSIPNFRMPTVDEVVGNLGEPLDFMEYRVEDDEDNVQAHHIVSDREQRDARTASFSQQPLRALTA